MIIADGEMQCSTCRNTPMKGMPMLEGQGGSVYCSPDCQEKDEEEDEGNKAFEDLGGDEEDYEE